MKDILHRKLKQFQILHVHFSVIGLISLLQYTILIKASVSNYVFICCVIPPTWRWWCFVCRSHSILTKILNILPKTSQFIPAVLTFYSIFLQRTPEEGHNTWPKHVGGYTDYYIILYYIMLCYVMLCYVMLCYVMLCYVMLYYIMLCYVMLCYVMLCYVMLCYVMLCYVINIILLYYIINIM